MAKTSTNMTRFLMIQCVAVALAAVGWEVWLDVYYLNGMFQNLLWAALPGFALVFLSAWPALTIRVGAWELLALTGASGLCWMLLGFPWAMPALWLVIGLILSKSSWPRVGALGAGAVVFGVLTGIQAVLVPLLGRAVASTGTIEWLSPMLVQLVRLTGMEAGTNAGQVVVRNAHFVWSFAPTLGALGILWVVAFAVPAAVLIGWMKGLRVAVGFLASMLILFPLARYLLLILVYLQWESIDWFFSPWVQFACLMVVVCNLAIVVDRSGRAYRIPDQVSLTGPWPRRSWFAAGLLMVAVLLVSLGLLLPDPGRRKEGRILVDEAHGGWEWTTEAFDTDWYGQAATYNYWCVFDYVAAHFAVVRNHEPISPQILAKADILVLKTPSKPFEPSEIEAIEQWVSNGGGLYLIGDHTNVFGMTTCLQPIAKIFGMRFGYDATYELETGNLQTNDISPLMRHPVITAMPHQFLWGTSCSLSASLRAEPVLVGRHIRTHYLDYGKKSFFPTAYMMPGERYGLILQSAAVRHGKGRVVAFTDSTIFSNFWTFFPGKSELFLGSLNWLNYSNTWRIGPWLAFASGLLCLALACRVIRSAGLPRAGLLLTVLVCVPLAIRARDALSTQWYSPPDAQVPLRILAFDCQDSDMAVPDFSMRGDAISSFQTFFTWVQRLDVVPRCEYSLAGAARTADRLVLIRPYKEFRPNARLALEEFFRRGGRLLVVDGPSNPRSLVNLLIQDYGLSMDFTPQPGGQVSGYNLPTPNVWLSQVYRVEGGEPLLQVGGVPVLSRTRVDQGEIWACTLADNWSDAALGVSNIVANETQRSLSELQYEIIELFMSNR